MLFTDIHNYMYFEESSRGWSAGKLSLPGRPTNLVKWGKGLVHVIPLHVGGSWLGIFFFHHLCLFSFYLTMGDSPIQTKIMTRRTVKPQQQISQSRLKA